MGVYDRIKGVSRRDFFHRHLRISLIDYYFDLFSFSPCIGQPHAKLFYVGRLQLDLGSIAID